MPATPARAHSCRAAGAVGKGLEARLCGLRPAPLAAARKGDHRSFRGPSLAAAAAPGPRPRRSPSPPRVASLELPRADAPEAPAAPSASATPGPLRSSRVPPPRDALILATGTDHAHTAGYAHSQHELAQVLAAAIRSGSILCCPRTVAPTVEEQAAKALRMFEAVGVQTRGSRHAPERFFEHERHSLGSAPGSCLERLLVPRLVAAAQSALSSWEAAGGAGAAGVTDLIVGGLTAPRATPGPDVLLARALRLPRTARRTALHHLGCLGGFRALSLAGDIARGDPHARVLVVYGDVSSLIGASLQSPMNEADLLSIAIFSDGAAAAVVGGAGAMQDGPTGNAPRARLLTAASSLLKAPGGESTADDMWLRESGFRSDGSIVGENFVGKSVPRHLMRALPPFLRTLLAQCPPEAQVAPLAQLPVLCHPGGPAILDACGRALQLQPWQLQNSWGVLRARGNMSGATNLFVLHDWLQAGAPGEAGAAQHAVGVAFGPGLSVEGLVLEALR